MKPLKDDVKLRLLEGEMSYEDIKDNLVLLFEEEGAYSSSVEKNGVEWCDRKLRICIDMDGDGRALCTIINPFVFVKAEMNMNDVLKVCFNNMYEDTFSTSLTNVMCGLANVEKDGLEFDPFMPTLVARKNLANNGASFIVNPLVCDKAFEKIGPFFIIFSSKHESLISPESFYKEMFEKEGDEYSDEEAVKCLIPMIRSVNSDRNTIRECDVFGESVYKYLGNGQYRSFYSEKESVAL